MTEFQTQVARLAGCIPNGELLAQTDPAAFVSAVVAEIERLQRVATKETERCMDLEAIANRLPKDAEDNPIVLGDELFTLSGQSITVWGIGTNFIEGDDGHVYCEKGIYRTREAAEAARNEKRVRRTNPKCRWTYDETHVAWDTAC